jgi:hypothetical protein
MDSLGRVTWRFPQRCVSISWPGRSTAARPYGRTSGNSLYPRNPIARPHLAGLLVALDQWSRRHCPPDSRVPSLAAGTLVARRRGVPALPDVRPPTDELCSRAGGLGASAAHARQNLRPWCRRSTRMGMKSPGCAYRLSQPLATYTGWNFYNIPGLEGILRPRGHMSALRQDASRAPGQE